MSNDPINTVTGEVELVTESSRFDVSTMVSAFQNDSVEVWSSLSGASFDDRLKTVNAMTNATPLDDQIGKPFELENFIVQAVEVYDDQRKQYIKTVRTVLIDSKGKAYAAVSNGIANSLQTLVGMVGTPDKWPHPIKVEAKRVRSRNNPGSFFTLQLV